MTIAVLQSPWLTYGALAQYTGYSTATLHVMQHQGLLPPSYGRGRARRFHVSDVDAWMRDSRRGLRGEVVCPTDTVLSAGS